VISTQEHVNRTGICLIGVLAILVSGLIIAVAMLSFDVVRDTIEVSLIGFGAIAMLLLFIFEGRIYRYFSNRQTP